MNGRFPIRTFRNTHFHNSSWGFTGLVDNKSMILLSFEVCADGFFPSRTTIHPIETAEGNWPWRRRAGANPLSGRANLLGATG